MDDKKVLGKVQDAMTRVKNFSEVELGYTKEEAKPFTKTLNELSSVLGEAFRKNDTKQK